ncbi:hypothetical protein [Streptomyces sp. NBC_01439]|uniref:hypothetical protein n=1 Tax=Streptomyces sp. NBC_01439 TaxID=2903867 RepID=UPI002E2C1961|nr:hypothetical protein [Streptomyces sp. NBC_01439]
MDATLNALTTPRTARPASTSRLWADRAGRETVAFSLSLPAGTVVLAGVRDARAPCCSNFVRLSRRCKVTISRRVLSS